MAREQHSFPSGVATGMARRTRQRIPATDDWQQLELLCDTPGQRFYEVIRPVLLFGQPAAERAAETATHLRSLQRYLAGFEANGLTALEPTEPQHSRRLPVAIRQAVLDLRREHPPLRVYELSTICWVRFGRRPSSATIKQLLAEEPLAAPTVRRFPVFHAMTDPVERRLAIIRLHADGWNVKSIAAYLETSRFTVYDVLHRWATEQFAGPPNKSSRPKQPATKQTLRAISTVKRLQENPELGEFRMYAALKQLGIELSPRTCGRILQANRALYRLPGPAKQPRSPKTMPYAAQRRHQYWSVDLRYIDVHQVDADPVYCISILENYSRAILASALSRRQDLSAYLVVLHAALSQYGSPEALVSDNGSIFKAARAGVIYAALGITHERIEHHQPWQDYIETAFNIQRRMADFHFAKATSWVELQKIHDKWVRDYNEQEHWAHRERVDERRSPAAVLEWVCGLPHDPAELARLFRPLRFSRRLDRTGYVRFRHWRLYGERGLPKHGALVWLSEETLTLGYGDEPLAYYAVAVDRRGQLTAVTEPRLVLTRYQSRQPWLWELSPEEWLLALQRPARRRKRPRRPVAPASQPLFLFDELTTTPPDVAAAT
jgi:transposase